ncbi:MAG: HsdR family type I site-specific deoxyribonuclease [Candidatus Enteromonas sp.]|nr:HsdR family type I site-specific deoxyribonuclease [Candidatus Enteromonas sp.]
MNTNNDDIKTIMGNIQEYTDWLNEKRGKVYNSELDFEHDFVELLKKCGWQEVIKNPTEEDLIKNWANILFDNNRNIDKLGDYPLVKEEMDQIIDKINDLRSPFALNSFINGKTISITRKNPDDKLHFDKEVSLKIYDRFEIAGGKSRYQIVEQPRFKASNSIFPSRRGDVMLLINGMPVFHIELKKSGIPLSQACNQIEKYSREGIFRGIYSLVQIFIALTPEDAVYFANPGPDVKTFNKSFFFHWADFNNVPIKNWVEFTNSLLYIPMAHQLIGFYTIPDKKDGILKVLRSYQYYAVSAITNVVAKKDWADKNQRGGFIWHTTGSGKTMTSFKAADLLSKSKDADKVVFLVDRIELDTQSLDNYRNFADTDVDVEGVDNTNYLIGKLKSDDSSDSLIVASIQKASRIYEDGSERIARDIAKINSKRIVFIVDECHRDTFGDMMQKVKETFKNALFFGFSGTPITDMNKRKGNTSADVFGDELHRYTIGDGIRDKNVLGFDPNIVLTFKDSEIKEKVALEAAKAKDISEALSDPIKSKKYYEIMGLPMTGDNLEDGTYVKGIEDYIPTVQYKTSKHREAVVASITGGYLTISRNKKFHSIFATSSIPEALQYYDLFKEKSDLKVTVLVDSSEDNSDGCAFKVESLAKVINDYNNLYKTHYSISTYGDMKKDISLRLSHERPYIGISNHPEKQLDMLIVVNQMLTGFDSKWMNALYLDKILQKENIIQAFSRTNRIFGPDKPFGIIHWYRKPHTMQKYVNEAISIYSGDKAFMVFVPKLKQNLEELNSKYLEIKKIFDDEGISDFVHLPEDIKAKAKFAKEFNALVAILEKAKVQGFTWQKLIYKFDGESKIDVLLTKEFFDILLLRYKELPLKKVEGNDEVPFDIDSTIIGTSLDKIDSDYLDSRFDKYLKLIVSEKDKKSRDEALNGLYSSFAFLSSEDQTYADLFIKDVQLGNAKFSEGKSFMDYVLDYKKAAKDNIVTKFADIFGLNEKLLQDLITIKPNGETINEFGRLDELKNTADFDKVIAYFSSKQGEQVSRYFANKEFDILLRKFILDGPFDIKS